jgi:histone-lysine N-methyltransferase SETMAR
MAAPIQSPAKCEVRSVLQFLNAKDECPAEIHPSYSPDLAPSGFHLFLYLKKHLAGKNFDDDDEVQVEVMTWFGGQAADLYDSGIQKLVPRLNKYLDNVGDYVEK